MDNNLTNLIEITMKFKTSNEASHVGEIIHNSLVGNPDYINTAVLLNINENVVTIAVGDEAAEETKKKILGEEIMNVLK